jgi:Putative mono-oxygenase ydhR
MERCADASLDIRFLLSKHIDWGGNPVRIRIVTFGLNIPADSYAVRAVHLAPGFAAWPGLLGKWWLGDPASGTFGGVYLFASRLDADRSRDSELFRGMFVNPALTEVAVREYDVLEAPTAITAAAVQGVTRVAPPRRSAQRI